ncbi:hypothetical protein SLE2022_402790 [Rubroshorea leprosula]
MTDAIVLYPSPGGSHLVSIAELAKLIQTHHSFSITIIITDAPFEPAPPPHTLPLFIPQPLPSPSTTSPPSPYYPYP